MQPSIAKRLKEFRKKTGLKMPVIAEATHIKLDTLYKWERGTMPRNVEQYNALVQYMDNIEKGNINWRAENLSADYNHALYKSSIVRIALRRYRRPLPLTNAKFTPGTITFFENEPELIAYYFDASFLGSIDGVIDVADDAMSPVFKNGSKMAITRLQDYTLLNWGECYYIIDKNLNCILRRVGPGETEDSISLLSDHADQKRYPPITRKWDQIETVFKVKAIITKF
jgi:transcriptional regulator with XRE-family HTH domain